jgi:hypothetical protein
VLSHKHGLPTLIDGCLNVADQVSITYTWTVDLIKPVIATASRWKQGCNQQIVAPPH